MQNRKNLKYLTKVEFIKFSEFTDINLIKIYVSLTFIRIAKLFIISALKCSEKYYIFVENF